MKRIHLIVSHLAVIVTLTFSFSTSHAQPISMEKAKQNVISFLQKDGKRHQKGTPQLSLALSLDQTAKYGKANQPLLYVFQMGDDGMVVASGDDRALPVLGSCDKGCMEGGRLPVNVQEWLNMLAEEIAWAQANDYPSKVHSPRKAKTSVGMLLQSRWGQDAPYNDQCVFDGDRCVTGCVATSMAQVMYYWATQGKDGQTFRHGSKALPSYTTEENGYVVEELPALSQFDWANMTDEMPTTTKGKAAVAQLMRYCGQAVEMDYRISGSGAAQTSAEDALQDCFGYNFDITSIYDNYETLVLDLEQWAFITTIINNEDWDDIVYENIANGCPVLIGASTGYEYVGHSFVCDGYDAAKDQYHFNWGWDGDYDGFYSTHAFPSYLDYTYDKIGIINIQPFAPSSYALVSPDETTVTFYRDTKKNSRSGTVIDIENGTWWKYENVTKAVFDKSFANARPKDVSGWFYEMKNLASIVGIKYLNTSEMESMANMFKDCQSLTSIDLSHFNTSKVKSMKSMFEGCKSLTTLDLSKFNTSNVASMESMFKGCKSLTTLNISKLDTSNLSSMESMFVGCSMLTTLDVSHFNTSKVKTFESMFDGCSSLTNLDVSNFDTSNSKSFFKMFYNCSSLTSLDVTHFNTSNVEEFHWMFYNCNNLASLDVTHFNTSKAKGFSGMFSNCNNLKQLDLKSFDTSNATSINNMFDGCSNLTELDVSHFDTSKIVNSGFKYAFNDCQSLTSLDVSNFDFSQATHCSGIFSGCSNLKSLKLPLSLSGLEEIGCYQVGTQSDPCKLIVPKGFDFNVDTHRIAFKWHNGYFYLEGGTAPHANLSNNVLSFRYDVPNRDGSAKLFDLNEKYNDPKWTNYNDDITTVIIDKSFAQARPTSTCRWFYYMNKVSEIKGLEYLNTSEVTNMYDMFHNTSITEFDMNLIDMRKVVDWRCMFSYCIQLKSVILPTYIQKIPLSAFDTCKSLESITLPPGVTEIGFRAFFQCYNLTSVTACMTTPPDIEENVFTNRKNAYLYVPVGCKNKYASKDYWKEFKGIIEKDVMLLGDVNLDGAVTIIDVTLLVDHILGDAATSSILENGDMNHDGTNTITDVQMLVDYILNHQ